MCFPGRPSRRMVCSVPRPHASLPRGFASAGGTSRTQHTSGLSSLSSFQSWLLSQPAQELWCPSRQIQNAGRVTPIGPTSLPFCVALGLSTLPDPCSGPGTHPGPSLSQPPASPAELLPCKSNFSSQAPAGSPVFTEPPVGSGGQAASTRMCLCAASRTRHLTTHTG